MRYASIRKMDVVNADGVGVSLFVQGCTHHCKGCFNPETWGFEGGKEYTEETEQLIFDLVNRPYIDCFSVLGGEPLQQDENLVNLLRKIRKNTNKRCLLWTGYESPLDTEIGRIMVAENLVDTWVVGPYIDEERDLTLKWRGSRNQCIINNDFFQKMAKNG